ncbi:MAG: RHS repeat-associated core domain-containing protein [Terracidiphilus sp.]
MRTEAIQPDYVTLYRQAFAEYGAQALWNFRCFDSPSPADALVVARGCALRAISSPAVLPSGSSKPVPPKPAMPLSSIQSEIPRPLASHRVPESCVNGTPANGFTLTTSWVLGQGGEQVTELAVSGATSTWVHTNVFAGGKLLATYHDSDTYFALSDWLGTKRAEITPDGKYSSFFSLPYGDGIPTSGTAVDATEHHYTGKERDTESGNDYFGARYYASSMGRFMSPDWDSKPRAVPYADLANPQSLNLYSYVLNNPLSKADPNGHDWFYVDKMWQWQKGHTYYDANGATKYKGYAGLLVATKTGVNAQGATTYHLALYGDNPNKPVLEGEGFSGSNHYSNTPAIKDGNYSILGRFDPPPTAPNPQSTDNNPPAAWGYQRIDPSLNPYAAAVYQAYGPMRAHLNPLDPGLPIGAYFHGQFGDAFHSEGWTHGCLSYGRDTRIIDYMADHFGNAMTGVSVK